LSNSISMRKYFIKVSASDNCFRNSMISCLRLSYSFFDMVIVSSICQRKSILSLARNMITKIYSQ